MLRINNLEESGSLTLSLEGKISGEWVGELERAWANARQTAGNRTLRLDLQSVQYVSVEGRDLLSRIHRAGGQLFGSGPLVSAVIEEVTGSVKSRRRRARVIGHLVGILFLVLMAAVAMADAQEAKAEVLTLEQAIALAVANNRQVAIAELEAQRSFLQVDIAKLDRLPSFRTDFYGSGLLAPLSFRFDKGAFGDYPSTGPIPDKDTEIKTERGFTMIANAEASQPLSDLYRIGLSVKARKLGAEMDKEKARAQRMAAIQQVRKAYYSLLDTESALAATQSAIDTYKELDRLMLVYVAERTAMKYEGLQIKAKLLEEQRKATVLRNASQSQKEQLNILMGRESDMPFLIEALPAAAPAEASLAEARARALSQRPEVKQSSLKAAQADLDRRIKKAEYIPSLSTYVRYTSPINFDFIPKRIATAGILLTWEPFDWGRKRREIEQKKLAVEQAKHSANDVRAQVVVEVGSAFRKLQEARAELEVAQLSQEAAREEARVTLTRYSEKAVLLKDVLEVQARVTQASYQHQSALTSFFNAKADLAKAMGEE